VAAARAVEPAAVRLPSIGWYARLILSSGFASCRLRDLRTYVQSGNVVLLLTMADEGSAG